MKKSTWLDIGSISTGSLQVEDVLSAVLEALDGIRLSKDERKTVSEVDKVFTELWNNHCPDEAPYPSPFTEDERDTLESDLNDIIWPIAENHCPDYCYFGAHEGDGADIGVWPSWESLSDDTGHPGTSYPVSRAASGDGRDTADPEHTHALEVNDHGNATLYRRAGNRWLECWSVV